MNNQPSSAYVNSTQFHHPIHRQDLQEQKDRFNALVASLGNPTDEEIEAAFNSREEGERDLELDPTVEAGLRSLIAKRLESQSVAV